MLVDIDGRDQAASSTVTWAFDTRNAHKMASIVAVQTL